MDNSEKQKQLERAAARKSLISGAHVLAWGAERGLSENDLIEIIINPRARATAIKSGVISKEASRRLIAQAQQTEDIDNYQVDPFGQDQSEYYTYGPDDYVGNYNDQELTKLKELKQYYEDESPKIRKARKKRDPKGYEAVKEDLAIGYGDINDRNRRAVPQAAIQDTIDRLKYNAALVRPVRPNTASQTVQNQFGIDLMKYNNAPLVEQYNLFKPQPDATEVTRNLQLYSDQRLQRSLENELSARVAAADRGLYSPVVRQMNDDAAYALSQQIAQEFTAGRRGALADEAIGRIIELKSLGGSGSLAPFSQYTAQRTLAPEDFLEATAIGNVPNTVPYNPNPNYTTALDFISQNTRELSEDPSKLGVYAPVDITLETTNFVNKLRNNKTMQTLGISPRSSNIRSMDELDQLVKYIDKQNKNRPDNKDPLKFYRLIEDEAGNKRNVYTDTVDVNALMSKLDATPFEKEQLATALFQIEAARRTDVNRAQKEAYISRSASNKLNVDNNRFFFDAADAIGGPKSKKATTPLASMQGTERLNAQSLKKGKTGRSLTSLLKGLDNPDARSWVIGLPKEHEGQQRTYKLRGNYLDNRTGQIRGPIKGRDHNMNLLNQQRARRAGTSNPMTREEYVRGIQDIREMQVKNYVAQVRASRAEKKRNKMELDRINLIGAPPADPKTQYAVGYGDDLRAVQQTLANQQEDMGLSNIFTKATQRAGQRRIDELNNKYNAIASQRRQEDLEDEKFSELIKGIRQRRINR